jgi:glycosyltransferase involved in cell wall biosynthesis
MRGNGERNGRIRIAHLQLLPILTGVQRVSLDELRRLDRDRFEPFLICQQPGPLSEAAERDGVSCIFVEDLVREISPRRDWRALRRLRELFRQESFDVIHTHSSKPGILGRFAGRLAGVPVVVHTVQGYAFPMARSVAERLFYLGLEWLGARCCDAMILVKNDDLDLARRYLRLPADKLHLVPNSIDTELYRPRGAAERSDIRRCLLGIDDRTVAIGMVGRLWRQKNPACLVRAAATVLQERQGVRFFLIGDGELRENLEKLILDLSMAGRVSLLGWRDDIPELLAGLDIFVLPSRWEGLPLAILEAQSAGVPVVASDIPGNRDAVVDGVDGLLFPDSDSARLSRALLTLLADKEHMRTMGQAGREKILARFRIEERVERMHRLYLRLLSRESPSVERKSAVSAEVSADRFHERP